MDRVAATLLPKRQLTSAEVESIKDILDAALAWQRGEIDINAVMQLGIVEYQGYESRPYSRFIAVGTTPVIDPRRTALLELLDVVVGARHVITKQGVFSRDELRQHDIPRHYTQRPQAA